MIENRRVRFTSIDGLRRSDVPVAGEVWLDDIYRSAWTTKEAMKIAAFMVRYMAKPDPNMMTLTAIEGQLQLGPEQTKVALKIMRMFGAIDSYTVGRSEIRAALNLTVLQKVRALEARHRLAMLSGQMGDEPVIQEGEWSPEAPMRVEAKEPAAV